jgi:hypothetical protein
MKYLLLMLLCANVFGLGTVTAVTNVTGEMTMVAITLGTTKNTYSKCVNLTPYPYTWNVNDQVNVSTNASFNAWTLNDITTAAISFCVVQTPIP